MVHVGGIAPSLTGSGGVGLPKSPSFHQGLAFATVLPHDINKQGSASASALHYQPLQPLLIGTILKTRR